MDQNLPVKFFYIVLALVLVAGLFLPLASNPNPKDCNNYPDGAGGYFLKCKDTHMSLYDKFKQK